MGVTDWIQLIGILVSLAIGAVSIVIAVKTLKQNSRMIEESTRPYITVYFETINAGSAKGFFIVKNFGQTGAYITDFRCDDDFLKIEQRSESIEKEFTLLNGTFLAPIQAKRLIFWPKGSPDRPATFYISYKSEDKIYKETVTLNIANECKIPIYRTSTKDAELQTISYAMQEMVERHL